MPQASRTPFIFEKYGMQIAPRHNVRRCLLRHGYWQKSPLPSSGGFRTLPQRGGARRAVAVFRYAPVVYRAPSTICPASTLSAHLCGAPPHSAAVPAQSRRSGRRCQLLRGCLYATAALAQIGCSCKLPCGDDCPRPLRCSQRHRQRRSGDELAVARHML